MTDDYELEERQALRRVAGLATELEGITEVEYRPLRRERVELAQMQYLLPRLRGWGESLSRQVGGRTAGGLGIGGRGPGETKIEIDRRRINVRMAKLRRELAAMKTARDVKRARRAENEVPSVVLAGY